MPAPSPTTAQKAAAFRALHQRDGAFIIPNPWDIGSAKILESIGFEALATSSGGLAWSLGKIDGRASADEVIEHCRAVCAAVSIPVTADLGPGFGDAPSQVAETIRHAIDAGLVGGSIEDAADPYMGGSYEFAHAVDRIAAAAEAASEAGSGDFLLTARCEHFVRGKGDFDDVVKRLQAFEAAGADVLYAPGLVNLEQIKTLCAAVSKPVNILIGFRGMEIAADDLAAAGAKRLSLGTDLARLSYGALVNAGQELHRTQKIDAHDVNARSSDIVRHLTS